MDLLVRAGVYMVCEGAAKLRACERKGARVKAHRLQNHLVIEMVADLEQGSQALCNTSGGRGER
jgi:hypothetical protein